MVYIGIDPGAKGGWSIIYDDGKVESHSWDDVNFLASMRELWDKGVTTRCALEKVGAMPGQGVVSMYNFGKSVGFIEGVLRAYDISYQTVPPQTWKKSFSLLHQDKNKSIETAQKLFPDVSLLATTRSRKPSDGVAESLLIAEYARRHF